MRDPFKQASRRIIRRLGKPVTFVDPDGKQLPAMKGVYAGPEEDAIVKGKKGGLVLKKQEATLSVADIDHTKLNKHWRIIIPHLNQEFFPADHDDDGDGCTVIALADPLVEPELSEGKTNANKWR